MEDGRRKMEEKTKGAKGLEHRAKGTGDSPIP
jgi:hypothetical protein